MTWIWQHSAGVMKSLSKNPYVNVLW
jgi:hypothetical protein